MNIQRVTRSSGNLFGESQKSIVSTDSEAKAQQLAKDLCVVVDGGHVHDANNKGRNFEVMVNPL